MPDTDNPTPSGPFDVDYIHRLVRLMKKYDVTAIDLMEGPTRMRFRRRGAELAAAAAAAAQAQAALPVAPAAAPAPAASAAPPAASAPDPSASKDVFIESPMVGTFYSSPAPDAPAFVNVGSVIRTDSTVCVIEAMKVFTDIPAGCAGTITEVLVKNGQPVEFGQPMFRVRPA